MGKKNRFAGGAVGRRTILQLSPPGSRGVNSGETHSGSEDEQDGDGHKFLKERPSKTKAPAVRATEGLSLLGAYEDSDDEDAEVKAPVNSKHNQSTDIDSTLADFMAEIDAITTLPATDGEASDINTSVPPTEKNSTQKSDGTEALAEPSTDAAFEYNTQDSLAGVGVEMGDWQEVWDDNSGCYYYWNIVTNQVSWELPHYLADQVQSLGKQTNNSDVNGNGTVHEDPVIEEVATKDIALIETNAKKEVIESVVALTNEEEERCGVAASLLGPLIPSEVKEAEEKWRKKLLKGLDETEQSVDSDGEGGTSIESPSVQLLDQDSALSDKDVLVKKLLTDNSDTDGPEEDTEELELALERKKAELRALEDGDGSAGGSSPCSDASQDATNSLFKKKRWKTAFPGAISPESNSRSSNTPESTETALPKAIDSAVQEEKEEEEEETEMETKNPEDADATNPTKEEVETPELKFQIGELANTLTSKMEFLGINKKTISNFQLLLLQTETRISDWREGALNGMYLRRRLQEAAEHIKYYELNATPKGWSCHWDREHRRYFYLNERTGASQWDFPAEEDEEEDAKGGSSATKPSTSWTLSQPPLPSSPPPPLFSSSPPPPLPPDSPPTPPPLPDSDSEIMEVEMEMDDDDGEPPAPGTEEDSERPPLPPGIIHTKIVESSAFGRTLKRKAGQSSKTVTIGSNPIRYTQPIASAAPILPVAAYWGVPAVPLVPSEPPMPPQPPLPPLPPPQPPSEPPPPKPTEKIKKTKNKVTSSVKRYYANDCIFLFPSFLKSKKIKTKMPSLVKKWQSIQKELDEEEKSSSSDEDRDILNKKTIEEWKHQQFMTGKASKNANFESIPDNWRDRIKKRKLNSATLAVKEENLEVEKVIMASSVIKSWWNSFQMETLSSHESNTEEDKEENIERSPRSIDLNQALKTRQLIINFDGNRPILSLRAPLDLVNFPSISGPRWPTECEVIDDTIHHIEWDPPQPEPFYQHTGTERMPLPTGDEKGKVVFSVDHATEHPFFTCSRVGGSQGPISHATCFEIKETDLVLEFESRFESGNLQKAVQVGPFDYELTVRCDMYTKKHTQWFYFRVRNMKAGVTYRFTIVNLMKSSSLYCYGMKPLLYSERAAKENGVGWQRTGFNIRYYHNCKNTNGYDTKSLYCLTWSLQFPFESDTCFVSHCYPYTYSQLQRYLQCISSNPNIASYCKLRILCHSLAGNAVYVMTVTSQGDSRCEERAKRAVVVTARVHPGETNGSWMMEGFLDFLLGNSADAQLLRDTFVFKIVPMLNPDGVIVGNYRCSLAGRDLNRNYKTTLKDAFPCVWHTRIMVEKLLTETDVVLYCDFHGHNRKNNAFMYGCNSRSDSTNLYERVFPLMMSKNASNKFSFKSCKFRVQKSKEGTGRIAMWRLGIRNSYTMEATFGGSTLGDRRGTHFSTRDLKSLGFSFCDTLLDFCDPDPSKANYCLTELTSLLSIKVKERLGKALTNSNFTVSDLETSTSGSNSTDSDGPPVHLLHKPNTLQKSLLKEKRKRLKSRKERNRLRSEPKVHESDKNMDSNQPLENTTKARHVTKEKKNGQVNKLLRKPVLRPSNTHPGEISQVTLWQGSKPVMNNCSNDMKMTCAYDAGTCSPLNSHMGKQELI
ncbi:formin-binding protein 4 [Eucyclogobius newberryi]|uniref:formin-binding protein 4 n=1 Tax=Eucyclogobius newberryi TaxID=166745 RepID=UPI003B5AB483